MQIVCIVQLGICWWGDKQLRAWFIINLLINNQYSYKFYFLQFILILYKIIYDK